MKRVDEKMRSLWAAWFVGGAVTAGLWLFVLGGHRLAPGSRTVEASTSI